MADPTEMVFGMKPDVAKYIPTIFGDEQLKAITENLKAFPKISQLGDAYYKYMLGSFNKAIPAFGGLLAKGGDLAAKMQETAGQELAGEIPKDVQDQLRRSTAFTNLMAGTSGSPMGGANQARNLGLTSLDMINKGAALAGEAGNAAQRWAGLASGLIMSPSGMMVTPQQQAALTMQNNLYKQATQQLQKNIDAAPVPAAKGMSDTIINLLGAYLGHGMGGGGGTAPNVAESVNSPGQSDVSNPGHYVNNGGGGGQGGNALSVGPNAFNMGFETPFQSGAYNTSGSDLFGTYQPNTTNPFNLASLFGSNTGTTDFLGTAQGGFNQPAYQSPTDYRTDFVL